jgi:carbon-monoxide dehydrogenase large subunit
MNCLLVHTDTYPAKNKPHHTWWLFQPFDEQRLFFTEHGQVLSSILLDYAVPLATELPAFELSQSETPGPRNILGAKGIGEAGCIGPPPVITNVVLDALSPLGVTELDMPLIAEKIWQAIHA